MGDITLESAEAAFCAWRAERISRAEPIPEHLWAMSLGLYPQHKRSTICDRLHLSGSQFKRRLEGGDATPADSGFVVATRDAVNDNRASNSEIQLTIQGKERALTLCVSVQALPQILAHVGVLL
jgi:hypothetical protein